MGRQAVRGGGGCSQVKHERVPVQVVAHRVPNCALRTTQRSQESMSHFAKKKKTGSPNVVSKIRLFSSPVPGKTQPEEERRTERQGKVLKKKK